MRDQAQGSFTDRIELVATPDSPMMGAPYQVALMSRSGKCQTSGARRAGQDRAAPKGSLDAPKRSRTIERRSDASVAVTAPMRPKHCSRQLDRARAVQRKNWCLREEPHQLLRRLGFGPSSVPRLSHECEVIQGAKQATVPGPAERELRHPHPLISDVRGGDADDGQPLAHGVRKHRAQRFHSRIGITTGSRDRSLMNSRCWRRPIRRMLPYQSPSRVVDSTADKSPTCFSRTSSFCVQRRTTIRTSAYMYDMAAT